MESLSLSHQRREFRLDQKYSTEARSENPGKRGEKIRREEEEEEEEEKNRSHKGEKYLLKYDESNFSCHSIPCRARGHARRISPFKYRSLEMNHNPSCPFFPLSFFELGNFQYTTTYNPKNGSSSEQ